MQTSTDDANNDPYIPRTPLMQQYFRAREENPGVLLLMRVGDFFEAYGQDAETIAAAINITLTGREDGGQRVAMAGVPHHAAERYIARLIRQGFRVAMMDQVEDPKQAKGLVKRRITRVMSRGTVFEDALLDAKSNNYLVAAVVGDPVAGLGVVDVSTGEFLTTEIDGERRGDQMIEEIARLEPAEVLVPEGAVELAERIHQETGAAVTFHSRDGGPARAASRDILLRHFGTQSLRGFGCDEYTAGVDACALVIDYLRGNHAAALTNLTSLSTYSTRDHMMLDSTARRNLELTSTFCEGGRGRTLLGVLDSTLTPMGGRLLRRWVEEPLLDVPRIDARLDAVTELAQGEILRGDLRDQLRCISDLERLLSRCSAGLANARDLVAMRESLRRLGPVAALLSGCSSALAAEIRQTLLDASGSSGETAATSTVGRLLQTLDTALADDPPAGVREGAMIRPGYSEELDLLRDAAANGRTWIASLESQERERTGIASLKVGYNAVFGYYIEISKANISKAPEDYIRKQTTANAERYITPALKEYEARVLGADDKAVELEYSLFVALRERVADASVALLQVARRVAQLDVLQALAEVAVASHYVRPEVNDGDAIEIRGGRHPVVERLHGAASFVPNDCQLDCGEHQIHIITGPNMAGKSTALRQVALIALMAQIGSFVPADSAKIGIVDRIFTRVGAHDELATGQSTFMVEMNETASILNNATPRSLVVLDEIGRGTSTYDGLSIAWAVVEHLARIGCKALFATHYHHLNEMARHLPCVKNYRVAVKERGDQVIWLHKLVPGGTDRSYGIQVARMAGVPPEVVDRAKEILRSLERNGGRGPRDLISREASIETRKQKLQLTLFEAEGHPVVEELDTLDVTALTPVEALMKLDELQRKARKQ